MNIEQDRKAFETAYRAFFNPDGDGWADRNGDDEYEHVELRHAWEGWRLKSLAARDAQYVAIAGQEPVAWYRIADDGSLSVVDLSDKPSPNYLQSRHEWKSFATKGEKAAFLEAWFFGSDDASHPAPTIPAAQEPPGGDWYCEEHPEHLMGHDGCTGAGIPECARVGQIANQLRLAQQEIRETARHRDDLVAQYRSQAATLREAIDDAAFEYSRYIVEDTAPRTLSVHMMAAFDAALGGKP